MSVHSMLKTENLDAELASIQSMGGYFSAHRTRVLLFQGRYLQSYDFNGIKGCAEAIQKLYSQEVLVTGCDSKFTSISTQIFVFLHFDQRLHLFLGFIITKIE